jgi:hypothetical protein
MATIAYEKQRTALLVIDPYNDFISEGGKIWLRMRQRRALFSNFPRGARKADVELEGRQSDWSCP